MDKYIYIYKTHHAQDWQSMNPEQILEESPASWGFL